MADAQPLDRLRADPCSVRVGLGGVAVVAGAVLAGTVVPLLR